MLMRTVSVYAMTQRFLATTLGLATATVGLAACGSGGTSASPSSGGTVQVVASTNVWGDVAKTIGGDQVQVCLLYTSDAADE